MSALERARQEASSIACLSNMKQAGTAAQLYSVANDGYMPGPLTSGYHLSRYGSYPAVADEDPTCPTQNMDGVSPVLGNELGLPEDRTDRMQAVFNHQFRCPSNIRKYDDVYGSWSGSIPATELYTSSYSMTLAFHVRLDGSGSSSAPDAYCDGDWSSLDYQFSTSPRRYKVECRSRLQQNLRTGNLLRRK